MKSETSKYVQPNPLPPLSEEEEKILTLPTPLVRKIINLLTAPPPLVPDIAFEHPLSKTMVTNYHERFKIKKKTGIEILPLADTNY